MQGGVAGVEQVVRRLPGRRPYTLLHCHTTATQYNTTDRRPYTLLHSATHSPCTLPHNATHQAGVHAHCSTTGLSCFDTSTLPADTAFLLPLWYKLTIHMA